MTVIERTARLLLSDTSLLRMGSFDFNQIYNIDTLNCRNFMRMTNSFFVQV